MCEKLLFSKEQTRLWPFMPLDHKASWTKACCAQLAAYWIPARKHKSNITKAHKGWKALATLSYILLFTQQHTAGYRHHTHTRYQMTFLFYIQYVALPQHSIWSNPNPVFDIFLEGLSPERTVSVPLLVHSPWALTSCGMPDPSPS